MGILSLKIGKLLKASVGLTWHEILFIFHSIDMDNFHEETFRNMEVLKVNKLGITWSFSRRTLKSDAYRPSPIWHHF